MQLDWEGKLIDEIKFINKDLMADDKLAGPGKSKKCCEAAGTRSQQLRRLA